MKVMTIVGTRPELIRLSRVIDRLDSTPSIHHILVHTGQNYDYELNQVFFEDLGIRAPDHMLGVDTTSLGTVLGGTLMATERVMLEEQPDTVLVLGDTNSCIAALMARRLRIPVYHMEAGNRCFDLNVPEETNRLLVDHVSDFNLVYTEHARRNLLAEGLHPRRILKTGSPMNEVLAHYRPEIENSNILDTTSLTEGQFFLVSAHREENIEDPRRLQALMDCLTAVREHYALPVFMSTHPRTRKRLLASGLIRRDTSIIFSEPLGFFDYNKLQMSAKACLSDSGTISEEAALLQFPAVTLRDSIERPEALDTGSIVMSGLDKAVLLETLTTVISQENFDIPDDYQITNTSQRVVNFILSTYAVHHKWAGLRIQER